MTADAVVNSISRLQGDLLRIWRKLLQTDTVSIDDDFFDVGGDSLLATELMLELRRLAGYTIPESLLFETATIRGVAERLSQTQDLQRKSAVRIGAAFESTAPLLFFHGDWTSGGFYLKYLAQKLGPSQPLIAIAPHRVGNGPLPSSIPAMAIDRLSTILEAQPNGPFRLVGHCVGGIVAFETARLLIFGGHRVEVVVMIDPPLFRAGEPLRARLPTNESAGPEKRWRRMRSSLGAGALIARRAIGRDFVSNSGDHNPAETANDWPIQPTEASPDPTWEWYGECLATYSPEPLAAPLLVFSSEFDATPWRDVSRDLEIIEVPGNHYDWVTKRAADFSLRLRSRLQHVSERANRE